LLPQWLPQPQPQQPQPLPAVHVPVALAELHLVALVLVLVLVAVQARAAHWPPLMPHTRNTSFVAVVVLTAGSYGAAAL
jgi:hypothetical protein